MSGFGVEGTPAILRSRLNGDTQDPENAKSNSRPQAGRRSARPGANSRGGWNTGRPNKPEYTPNTIQQEHPQPGPRSASAAPSRRQRFQGIEASESNRARPSTGVKRPSQKDSIDAKQQTGRPSTGRNPLKVTIEIPKHDRSQSPKERRTSPRKPDPQVPNTGGQPRQKHGAALEINGLLSSAHRHGGPVGCGESARPHKTETGDTKDRGERMMRSQSARMYGAKRLASHDGTPRGFNRIRSAAPSRGWADNRPRVPNLPVKCSDRTVQQPLLQAQTKQLLMASKKHAAAKEASEALNPMTPKTPMNRAKKAQAQSRWAFATKEVVTRLRNAKELADELLKDEMDSTNANNRVIFSKHGDYLLISKGKEQVRVAQLEDIAASFDSMHPDEHGHVPYIKILRKMGVANHDEEGGGGKSRIMNRAPVSAGGGNDPDADARSIRAANRVFNFEDMLKFQYPSASWSDIRRMANTVAPGAKPLGSLSREKILEGVQLFKKMDPEQTGLVNYDHLEEVLIKEYPRANVYKVIKTMPEEILQRLFGGGVMTLKEFVMWYGKILTADWRPHQQSEEMTSNRGTFKHKRLVPHEVLSLYVDAYPERQHFAQRFIEEARRTAFEERASVAFIRDIMIHDL